MTNDFLEIENEVKFWKHVKFLAEKNDMSKKVRKKINKILSKAKKREYEVIEEIKTLFDLPEEPWE